jgi:hypothetical protein
MLCYHYQFKGLGGNDNLSMPLFLPMCTMLTRLSPISHPYHNEARQLSPLSPWIQRETQLVFLAIDGVPVQAICLQWLVIEAVVPSH